MDLIPFFVLCYSTLFAIMDPVGVSAIFLAMTKDDRPDRRLRMARIGSLTAGGVLLFFSFGGQTLFQILGISHSAFQIAGGIILLLAALDMLRARPSPLKTSAEEETAGLAKEDIAVTPLAVPLLAGPGAISAALVLSGRATTLGRGLVLTAAIAAITLTAYLALRWSIAIGRLLGTIGARVLERIVGLILAALAVQFVVNGVAELIRPA